MYLFILFVIAAIVVYIGYRWAVRLNQQSGRLKYIPAFVLFSIVILLSLFLIFGLVSWFEFTDFTLAIDLFKITVVTTLAAIAVLILTLFL